MSPVHFLAFILIGAAAGWLCGLITKGSGFGVIGNIIVGIVGAFLGGFCLNLLGFAAYGVPARLVSALLGALIFVWLLRFIKK